MKALLKLLFFLFISIVLFSCQKENDDIDMIVGSAKNELPFTTSAKARFYGNDFLNQLNAIPVYIFYEEGAVAPTKNI